MNKQEFMKKHDRRIMDEIKRSALSKLWDKITNTKRDIYGYHIYPDNVLYRLVRKHLHTVKDEIELHALAKHLDTHWIRLKHVMYRQEYDGIKLQHKSLIEGWEPERRDGHIYFKRTQQ